MSAARPLRKASYEEYLALERGSETKHEYVNGEITNPVVLVEVLSPTTEMDDRGDKWAHYRRIPSLECYVLVAQDQRSIETYRREGRRWIYEAFGPGEVATIAGAEASLAVDELYASALEAG